MITKKQVEQTSLNYNVFQADIKKEIWSFMHDLFHDKCGVDGNLILDKMEIDAINSFANLLTDIFDDYNDFKVNVDTALKECLQK